MLDYNPEELTELHRKRMEEVQSMINKIATDPTSVSVDDLMKTIGHSDNNKDR